MKINFDRKVKDPVFCLVSCQAFPAKAFIELDVLEKTLEADYTYENGVPQDVFDGYKRRYYINPNTSREFLNSLETNEFFQNKIEEILALCIKNEVLKNSRYIIADCEELDYAEHELTFWLSEETDDPINHYDFNEEY